VAAAVKRIESEDPRTFADETILGSHLTGLWDTGTSVSVLGKETNRSSRSTDGLNWQLSSTVITSSVDERLVNDGKFEFWENAQDNCGRTGNGQLHLLRLNLKRKGKN